MHIHTHLYRHNLVHKDKPAFGFHGALCGLFSLEGALAVMTGWMAQTKVAKTPEKQD